MKELLRRLITPDHLKPEHPAVVLDRIAEHNAQRKQEKPMPDSLLDRMAWALRCYKNAAEQGRPVPTHVTQTAVDALNEYDIGVKQDAEDAPDVMRRIAAQNDNLP